LACTTGCDGICGISHPANLVNWLTNNVFHTEFTIHSIFVTVPVLTSVGFILGGFIAAFINKEFKFRPARCAITSWPSSWAF
jgi:hypothetical protein